MKSFRILVGSTSYMQLNLYHGILSPSTVTNSPPSFSLVELSMISINMAHATSVDRTDIVLTNSRSPPVLSLSIAWRSNTKGETR
jgi:hypothetical protein